MGNKLRPMGRNFSTDSLCPLVRAEAWLDTPNCSTPLVVVGEKDHASDLSPSKDVHPGSVLLARIRKTRLELPSLGLRASDA